MVCLGLLPSDYVLIIFYCVLILFNLLRLHIKYIRPIEVLSFKMVRVCLITFFFLMTYNFCLKYIPDNFQFAWSYSFFLMIYGQNCKKFNLNNSLLHFQPTACSRAQSAPGARFSLWLKPAHLELRDWKPPHLAFTTYTGMYWYILSYTASYYGTWICVYRYISIYNGMYFCQNVVSSIEQYIPGLENEFNDSI